MTSGVINIESKRTNDNDTILVEEGYMMLLSQVQKRKKIELNEDAGG